MIAWIIDDDDHVSEFYMRGLKELGCQIVYRSASLTAAREDMAAMTDAELDVIILDLRLPDGEGIDLLPSLSAHPDNPAVVIVTGFATMEDTVTALRHGVCDFLHKPVGMADLKAAMKRVQIRQQLEQGLVLKHLDSIEKRFEAQDVKIDEIKSAVLRLEREVKKDPGQVGEDGQ